MPGLDALTAGPGQTDQRDARHAIGGLLAVGGPTALDIRTGVLHGPGTTALITGTTKTGPKMSVLIGAHHSVGSRGAANGPYLGPTLDAATEVDVDLAPASGSRIDVVWERQRDTTSGVPTPDASAGPEYGVLKGTSSTGTPAKPDLATLGPVGATELGTVTVAAGATSTNGAGITIANTARLTVARGADIPVRNQSERDTLTGYATANHPITVRRLDTGVTERNAGSGWQMVVGRAGSVPFAMAAGLATIPIPAANTTVTYTVNLPAGRFTQRPVVTVTPVVSTPGYVTATLDTPTATSFGLFVTRQAAGTAYVMWQAIQSRSAGDD